MRKYTEGINFIDSLNDGDSTFGYQKKMKFKSLKALTYFANSDIVNRNLVYAEMAIDLEQYIKMRQLSDKEFEEIYIYLYATKNKFLDSNQINKEIKDLEKRYPDQAIFFDFLKK